MKKSKVFQLNSKDAKNVVKAVCHYKVNFKKTQKFQIFKMFFIWIKYQN